MGVGTRRSEQLSNRGNPRRFHIRINVSEAAKNYIVDCGYDPNFGARPLRRFIQRKVETLAAKRIIGGNLSAGDTINIDLDENGELVAD